MSWNLVTQALGSPIRCHLFVRRRWWLALLFCLANPAGAADTLDLSGNWRFAIERRDEGITSAWFNRALADRIALPGILQAQGYGDDISAVTPWVLSLYDKHWSEREDYKQHAASGKVRVPFLSEPPKHYLGAAWYQRDIDVAPGWRGKRVVLFLERPHWGSTLWLDTRKVGSNLSLASEHAYDLGFLAPGKHRLSIRVDNRMLMSYRPDAHSVSDSLGMSWNGIVGKVELRATSPVWIDDAQAYPNVQDKSELLKVKLGNMTGQAGAGVLTVNGVAHKLSWSAEGTDFLVMQRIGPKPLRGNKGWFGKDYGDSPADVKIPVLSHEAGQWVAYPDFDIIQKFTGYLHPGNYEIFRDSLQRHGLAAKNKDFAYASGKFQLASYKEEIEANLRTPGMMGYQLLDLHDYLGQGSALVGILDTFWEEKGYATASEFRRFNGQTVPLARLLKRVFTADETFSVAAEIAHFGELPLVDAQAYWKRVDAVGKVVAQGDFARQTINVGKNSSLGTVKADLSLLKVPGAYRLVVGVKNTPIENDWNFWVYPSTVDAAEPAGVLVTHSWTEAQARLSAGGKVLYMPRKADLDWNSPPLDTLPVFWNRLMNPAWGRMLGLWVDHRHAALAGFPSESFNDWQWTELVNGAGAVNLDRLPPGLQPIVQPIDDWNRNFKLGMLFEAKVGAGSRWCRARTSTATWDGASSPANYASRCSTTWPATASIRRLRLPPKISAKCCSTPRS